MYDNGIVHKKRSLMSWELHREVQVVSLWCSLGELVAQPSPLDLGRSSVLGHEIVNSFLREVFLNKCLIVFFQSIRYFLTFSHSEVGINSSYWEQIVSARKKTPALTCYSLSKILLELNIGIMRFDQFTILYNSKHSPTASV